MKLLIPTLFLFLARHHMRFKFGIPPWAAPLGLLVQKRGVASTNIFECARPSAKEVQNVPAHLQATLGCHVALLQLLSCPFQVERQVH